jgi:TolB-like protein/class 3 adenylate cyclase/Flp pilus assembly protein TadD
LDRKLTAILYADVAGYSRLTGADEKGTHESLKVRLGALTEAITGHGGRICHFAGDAVLAEFASVVTALECAVAAQRAMAERDRDVPEIRKLQFRIGVNLGDVMVDGEEIYGNGVNVAARLETLADAGGICISGRVLEQVENNVDVGFAFLGAQNVKNIAKPVNVYKILFDRKFAGKTINSAGAPAWRWPAATVIALVILTLGGVMQWLRPSALVLEPASKEGLTIPLSKGPTIAVLPFDNMSGDKEQEYFADGMTDDLITRLSQISGLFVIARNSVFTYKGKPAKVQDVAKDLGVRYVLEGSVRKDEGTIRINAQLIDAESGGHLWAEKFDRPFRDVFALQDQISERIAEALSVKLTGDEQTRLGRPPTTNLEAYEAFLKAGPPFGYDVKSLREKLALFKKATELDPNFAEAYAADAAVAAFVYRTQWWPVMRPTKAHARALEGVTRALALNPDSPLAHSTLGILQLVESKHEEAIRASREAVSLAPHDAHVRANLALVLAFAGRYNEAAEEMETVLRLDPKPPASIHIVDGFIHFIAGDYRQALERLLKAKATEPDNFVLNTLLGGAYARLDRMEEAHAAIELALKGQPVRAVSSQKLAYPYMKRVEDLDRFADSLRLAGLPEWSMGFTGAENERLSGEEIKDLLWGQRIEGNQMYGSQPHAFSQTVGADGTWEQISDWGGKPFIVKGTSSVESDMWCTQDEDYFFGSKQCVPVYRNPGGTRAQKNEYVFPRAYYIYYFSVAQ